MGLNILNKKFFQTEFGKRVARKHFGYNFDEDEEKKARAAALARRAAQLQSARPVQQAPQAPQEAYVPQVEQEPVKEEPQVRDVPAPTVPAVPAQHQPSLEETVQAPDFDRMFSHEEDKRLAAMNERIQQTQAKLSTKNSMGLHDIVRNYKNQGVVGEESLVCAITLAAINGSSFGVEGFSGSGKTYVTDKLIELLPDVYSVGQSSDLAIFNDENKINGSKFLYIPELQKAMQKRNAPIIEVIKDLTEGKDANRLVTTRSKKGGTKEFSIKKGISIIYTLAIENHFKKDEESSRRLIRFRTDSSSEHLEEIHSQKAKNRYTLGHSKKAATRLQNRLREHVGECMDMKDVNIIDPFADYFAELIPKTQKSVGYVDHYYSLLDGCTKFHFNERTRFEIDGEVYLVVNLEDHYNVFQMYFKEFVNTLKDLATDEEETHPREFDAKEPNWRKFFEEGYKVMTESPELEALRDEYPQEVDNWYSSQVQNDVIATRDYKTGKAVAIVDMAEPVEDEAGDFDITTEGDQNAEV
ncbi:hypothetical protein KY343_01450 [Candidatus Woesearchaeota archaeon]|nr:hypothetical protein [Candidatus Woesearchaeota archaeon]